MATAGHGAGAPDPRGRVRRQGCPGQASVGDVGTQDSTQRSHRTGAGRGPSPAASLPGATAWSRHGRFPFSGHRAVSQAVFSPVSSLVFRRPCKAGRE